MKNKYLPIITPVNHNTYHNACQDFETHIKVTTEQRARNGERKNCKCKWADDELAVLFGTQDIIAFC